MHRIAVVPSPQRVAGEICSGPSYGDIPVGCQGEDGRSPPSTVLVSLHREAQPRSFSSASGLSSSLDRRRGAWRFSTSTGASGAAGAESRGGRWFRSGGGSGPPNGGGLVPAKTACIAGERPSIPGK